MDRVTSLSAHHSSALQFFLLEGIYVTAGSLKFIPYTPCCYKLGHLEVLLLLLFVQWQESLYAGSLDILLFPRKWRTLKRDNF